MLVISETARGAKNLDEVQPNEIETRLYTLCDRQSQIVFDRRQAIHDREDRMRSQILRQIWRFFFGSRSKEESAENLLFRTAKKDLAKAERQLKITKAALMMFRQGIESRQRRR